MTTPLPEELVHALQHSRAKVLGHDIVMDAIDISLANRTHGDARCVGEAPGGVLGLAMMTFTQGGLIAGTLLTLVVLVISD